MKPAAFVADGHSLAQTLDELRALDAKVFATPKAAAMLEREEIRCQVLADPLGIARIFNFGHKEIHLFGFDLSNDSTEGSRVCFEDRVFYTTQELATHAQMLLQVATKLMAKGASIAIHGDGMFPHMARHLMRTAQERVLTAIYDMQICPPTYEVLSFLAESERYRVANGFTCIDVIFFPGPMHGFRDDGLPPSVPERVSMLHRICVGAARLLPSVRNIHVMQARSHVEGEVFPPDWTNDRPRFVYGPRYQKNGYRCLAATQAARDEINQRFPKPYTTITMREAEYWPARNSNRTAWDRAARYLQMRGTPAVVVPDTHGRGIPGVQELAPAAWDIDLRLALYESAVLNLGVQNGPMALMMFAVEACPYILFQKPDETSPGTQEEFMEAHGIKHGDQWTNNGLTIWGRDDPDAVESAIEEWFRKELAA